MITQCVVDGKSFEISQHAFETLMANAGDGIPMIVCSDVCAAEYDINCLDWSQAKRDAHGIRPY